MVVVVDDGICKSCCTKRYSTLPPTKATDLHQPKNEKIKKNKKKENPTNEIMKSFFFFFFFLFW